MKIEVNIGLASSSASNHPDARDLRLGHAIRHIMATCPTAYIDRRTVAHEGPDGTDTIEDTLVAELDTNRMTALDIVQLKGRMHNLAAALGQDCIAMYIPERDTGELVGPKAAEWGDFKIEFFARRYLQPALRKAA